MIRIIKQLIMLWFLTTHPNSVEINAFVASLPKSYQRITQRFMITSNSEDTSTFSRICVPFPWSPEKDDGGLKFIQDDDHILDTLLSASNTNSDNIPEASFIRENDVKVYRKVLSLKNDQLDVNPLLVIDLAEKYSWDDWGFMTFEILPNKWYTLSYTHKISVYSTLCVPTILPINLVYKGLPISVNVFAADAEQRGKQKFLTVEDVTPEQLDIAVRAGFKTLDRYTTDSSFNGDSDVSISTCNWESSDDELGAGYSSDE